MDRIQFRLSDELSTFVKQRAIESKITPSEYIRLLIVRDIDDSTRARNIALDEVNNQLAEMRKSITQLQEIKEKLSG